MSQPLVYVGRSDVREGALEELPGLRPGVNIADGKVTHPAVAEAVCFGIPDRVYGEGVAAAVVLKSETTQKELIAHCRASLSDFKCPTTIYVMEAIPRTATGKIQRRNVAAAISKNL